MFRIAAAAALMYQVVGCGGDDGTSAGSTTADTEATTSGPITTSGPSSDATTSTTTTDATTTTVTTTDPTDGTGTTGGDSSTGGDATSTGAGVCGDGVVDPGEACDDGNADDTDACTSACVAAVCGDGIVQAGVEACDDGNQVDDDVCLNSCALAVCGDGFLGPGEACDDGNQVDDDACTNSCALPSCGDGKVQQGEECDDGNAESGDACLNTCLKAICGDSTIQVGVEACDDANDIDTDECIGTCQLASCGDGFVQDGVEACDDGNKVDTDECIGTCQPASCGDGFVQAGVEACDDGNMVAQDGCENDCTATLGAASVVSGWNHTCVLTTKNDVYCWGRNTFGSLGQGDVVQIGDDELPSVLKPIDIGAKALSLVAGEFHTCALVENGKVRCWGRSNVGQLGLANIQSIGDNEQPWSVSDVPIGGTVTALAAGRTHTCALLTGGKVRCWGGGVGGPLGYGNVNNIGDNETPASAGDVSVGGIVKQLAAGESFTCALLDDGKIRCWGLGTSGTLGYGNVDNIGDDELPSSVLPVPLGANAKFIAAGRRHTCAIAVDDTVHCWGLGSNGQLGYGNTASIGDNETPSVVGFVSLLGAKPVGLALNYASTCVLLDSGKVRCWGNSTYGQLGLGDVLQIGDNEAPSTVNPIDVGVNLTQISANWYQTCGRGEDYSVRCWGRSEFGQLGYGNLNNVGDDELPSAAGPVMFLP
jgi:cysteine-rich repeat protein